jgi:cytochrome c6
MKKFKTSSFFKLFIIIFIFLPTLNSFATNREKGKNLFNQNCIACHKQGTNLIIPEKNLKKNILEANGMYNEQAIIYQIINGKNGMPAFGGRLTESEIEDIANYVIFAAEKNFDF